VGIPLYLLISGTLLYWGLLLVAAGVVASTRRPSLGRILAWSGMVFTLASAVPLHPALYVLLLLLLIAWQVAGGWRQTLKHRLAGAVLGGVVLTSAAALLDSPGSRMRFSTGNPVFVIGDSLSAGIGASHEGTWPELMSRRLNLEVHNLARPGATLADGKVQAGAIPKSPAMVLVELGGNDLLGGTSAARFEADLRSLLAIVVGDNRSVVMFELPLLPFQNSFGRIQREVCRGAGVLLLPRSLLAGAVALPGHASDGLHLSPAGHLWLAERVGELWSSA
jgi:acyl-CoA thioesterase-1